MEYVICKCCFCSVMESLWKKRPLYVAAPMVRYSKLPFRKLVRRYGVDLAFTPMIIASSFVDSEYSRNIEFTTDSDDRPLIVQFAANNAVDLWNATEFVYRHSTGVDLNCGCPQRWAIAEGFGCHLIDHPELLADMIGCLRRNLPCGTSINDAGGYSISIKIRVHDRLDTTVELCRRAERAAVSFVTVHGRTKTQRKQPVNYEAIKLLKGSVSIPVFANGDITSKTIADDVVSKTGCDGVMAARGLLRNPAMFSGNDLVTMECVKDWLTISTETGVSFSQFHHHLMFMLDRLMPKADKRIFNRLQSIPAVFDFLEERYQISVSS